jgi:hypothetical protein
MPPLRIIFLPFALLAELLFLALTLIVSFISTDRSLKMVEWAQTHIPDLTYWVSKEKKS